MPPPLLFLSSLYGFELDFMLNGVSGNVELNFFSETISKSTLSRSISVTSSNLFLRVDVKRTNYNFLRVFCYSHCLLHNMQFVFRILLVRIDLNFFTRDDLEYVGAIFLCVWASVKLS